MRDSHRSPNSSNAEKNRSDTMAKSPSHSREMGGFYLIFWLRNYPHATGTRPTAVATEIFHIPSDLAHSIGFSGRQMGFDHRIGHFRPLRMATRVVEYHIYLRLGRF